MERRLGLRFGVCLLTAAAAGCAQPPPLGDDHRLLATPVQGIAFLTQPLAGARLWLSDYGHSATAPARVESETDAAGLWGTDLGHLYGDFIVRVDAGEDGAHWPLERVLPDVALETGAQDVAITAITHLTAALTRFKVREEGLSPAAAHAPAAALIGQHFGAVDHATIIPINVSVEPLETLTAGAIAGFMAQFLEHLATRLDQTYRGSSSITLSKLLAALADDVEADGVFDGVGQGGAIVSVAEYRLSGETLRGEFAMAGLRWLESEDLNTTALAASDLRPLLLDMANSDSALFRDPARGIDATPPVITWDQPSEGDSVAGVISVAVRAADDSPISAFRFVAPASIVPTQPVLSADEHAATLTASFDTLAFDDGPIDIVVQALDASDNSTRKTMSVQVNNIGPRIEVVGLENGATVSGLVVLQATAADADGLRRFEVVDEPAFADGEPALETIRGVWDSQSSHEGGHTIVFEAEDMFGHRNRSSLTVMVDNVALGTISGTVALDSSVQGATVRAYELSDSGYGAAVDACDMGAGEGACRSTKTGLFEIRVSDSYAGPLLLVARGTVAHPARYQDATTGATIEFGSDDALWHIVDHYEPGQAITERSINGASTLAAAYTLRLHDADLAEAAAVAHRRVGEHLRRPTAAVDVRRAVPVDLSTTAVTTLSDAALLGLFHAGLSRFGAEIAVSHGLSPSARPTITMLGHLVRDLDDVVFDGRGGPSGPVFLVGEGGGVALRTNTLRSDLAMSTDRFVRNESLLGTPSGRNASGLQSSDLSILGGYYDDLSSDRSALFGRDEPLPFDQEDPVITITQPISGAAYSSRIASIEATCTDNVRGQQLEFLGPEEFSPIDADSAAAHFVALAVSTTPLLEGEHSIDFACSDAVGRTVYSSVVMDIDRSAPDFVITSHRDDSYVGNRRVRLAGTVSDRNGVHDVRVNNTPASLDGWSWSFDLDLAEEVSLVNVRAADPLGNADIKTITLRLDLVAPHITQVDPVEGSVVGRAFSIEVQAEDNRDLTSLEIISPTALANRDADPAAGRLVVSGVSTDHLGDAVDVLFRATDHVGLTDERVVSWTIDRDGPEVIITSHVDGQFVSAPAITVAGVARDGYGVASVHVNGARAAYVPGDPVTWQRAPVALVEGPNPVEVVGTDSVGNATSVSINVLADLTDPWVTVARPSDGAVVSAMFGIDARVEDNFEAVLLEIVAPPELVGRDLDSDPKRVVVDGISRAELPGGIMTISFLATDHVGRISRRGAPGPADVRWEIRIWRGGLRQGRKHHSSATDPYRLRRYGAHCGMASVAVHPAAGRRLYREHHHLRWDGSDRSYGHPVSNNSYLRQSLLSRQPVVADHQ